jgi:hypothetical protein
VGGDSTLESLKIVVAKYNILKVWNFILSILFLKSIKDEYFVCDEYIWTKLIPIKKMKNKKETSKKSYMCHFWM